MEKKFRYWDPFNGELVSMNNDTALSHFFGNYDKLLYGENNPILEQWTGLKDKNGVEIFEGDVYHQGDPNIKYVVVWHDTGLKGKQLGSSSYAGISYWQDRIEIIGNIHLNPELLKKD